MTIRCGRMLGTALALAFLLTLTAGGAAEAGPDAPQGVIEGVILDPEGRPVAGARIRATPPDPARWVTVAGARALKRAFASLPDDAQVAQSGSDGRFRLDGLEDGVAYHLQVFTEEPLLAAGSHATAYATAPPATHLTLQPARRVEARLVDPKGRGVAGHVSVFGQRRSGSFALGIPVATFLARDVPTDAEGRCELVLPATLWLRVEGRAAGIGTRSVSLAAAGGPASVEIALETREGASAGGRVTDASGKPLPGAMVLVGLRRFSAYRADGRVERVTRTDAEGRWSITGLPEGWITHACAWQPGLLPTNLGNLDIPLRRDAPWEAEFLLGTGARIHGRVLDQEGAPIPGAKVTHLRGGYAGTSYHRDEVVTDADGRYAFDGVPSFPGALSVTAPGFTLSFEGTGGADHQAPSLATPLVEPGGVLERTLVVIRGRALHGRVVDTTGKPIPGAAGALTESTGHMGAGGYRRRDHPFRCDAEGRFRIEGVDPAATLTISAHASGHAHRTAAVHLPESASAAPLEVVLGPGTVLRGSVVDRDGKPMADMPVGLSPGFAQTSTDANGRFEILSGQGGTLRLHLGHTMHAASATLVVDVAEGTTRDGLVLRWPGGEEIGGVVVDEEGEPQADVLVSIQHERIRTLGGQARTDVEGRWHLRDVPEGRYSIRLEQQWPAAVTASTGTLDVRAVLRTSRAELIDGVVVGPDGEPIARGNIGIARVDEAPHTQRGRAPIVGGRFRVQRPDGMPGALALTVTDARDAHGRTFPARLRRIVVDADTPRPVTIRLEAGGEVAGRVVDGNGDPIGGVLLTLTRKGQTSTPSVRTSASAWSDESGRYRFVGLDPGPHQIAVSPGTVYIHRQPLEVETGDTDVVFELKRWRSIRGVVLGLDGKPLKGCVVALGLVPQTYARPHRGAVSTDDKGRFTLWRVMEGKPVHVTASPPRGSEGPAVPGTTRDVRPGAHDVVVRLRRGVTIEGHVRGIEGEPIPDCAVTTTNVRTSDGERSNWYHRPKTTTDENGRFVLGTFLPDLLADLSFVVPRSSKRRYFPETRKGIASGSRKLDVAMEHGVVIRGEVQGVDVSLLKGLRLTATPALTEMRQVSARTTLDGTTVRFEIGPLKPGPHLVKPSLRRSGQLFLPREVRAEAPSSNVVITVERAWYVSGRVIAKNPRGYRVRFHPPEGRGLDTTIRSTDGTFRLGRVRDHPGQLFVSLNGSKLVGLLENVLPSKGPFEVELAEGRTISGRITDLVGKVSRGKIIARRGQVTLSAGIAEDGWFETAPLPPGAWTLEVQASRPSGGTYLAPAEVQAGARNVLIRYIPSR